MRMSLARNYTQSPWQKKTRKFSSCDKDLPLWDNLKGRIKLKIKLNNDAENP